MHTTRTDPHSSALALILARGGSKGVPRKNAASIAGRPCLAWTIADVKSARLVAHMVVSTDDPELANIARREGIQVVPRPTELATDTATVDAAARHAIAECPGSAGGPIVILYGNVPVRPAGLIDRAIDLLLRTNCDSVQSYAPVGKHHPWWTARIDAETGRVAPWEGHTLNHGIHRRQDLPPAHIPDGGVLVVSRRALMLEVPGVTPGPHAFFGADRRGILTSEGEVIDIDSPIDLLVADAVLRARR